MNIRSDNKAASERHHTLRIKRTANIASHRKLMFRFETSAGMVYAIIDQTTNACNEFSIPHNHQFPAFIWKLNQNTLSDTAKSGRSNTLPILYVAR